VLLDVCCPEAATSLERGSGRRGAGADVHGVTDFASPFENRNPLPLEGGDEREAGGDPLVALLAGAGVALVGGLVWAAFVIATRIDIGMLAFVIGAFTGTVVFRLSGRRTSVVARVLAAAFAALGILLGKYVIFVHDVKSQLGDYLAAHGVSVSYLDPRQLWIFVHHLGTFVRPMYALWIGLAALAAIRSASGRGPRLTRSYRRVRP
jgi:hypothetical protein